MKGVGELSNTFFEEMLALGQNKIKTEKQQRIVDTAINLFAEKGYSNTSTAEIAKAAEVSEGTIFKHYGTKDKLLLSIILPFIKNFFPIMAKKVIKKVVKDENTTFEEFIRGFLKDRVEFLVKNREIFQVVIKEFIYREELKKELLPYFSELVPSILSDVIEEFKRRGELIDIPTKEILNIMLTLFSGFFISRFVLLENYTVTEEEIENIVQFVMDGLRNH